MASAEMNLTMAFEETGEIRAPRAGEFFRGYDGSIKRAEFDFNFLCLPIVVMHLKASGEVRQVTAVATGVSGVTGLSPALSVASRSDRMAYTVYRHGGYEIHVSDLDASTPPAVTEVDTVTTHAFPTVLMPAPAASFSERPYRAGLRLDRLVQPYLSAGGGSSGSFIRGGVGLSFADMLGNRQLDFAVQAGKQVDDFIAQATYLNMRSRWNCWAAGCRF